MGNNPVNLIDPTGHCGMTPEMAVNGVICAEFGSMGGGSYDAAKIPTYVSNWVSDNPWKAVAVGVLCEPCDWGMTYSDFVENGPHWTQGFLLIPFVPGTVRTVFRKGDEVAGAVVKPLGPQALANGPPAPKGGVYTLQDDLGNVVRTGRTNDLDRRFAEHARDPVLKDYFPRVEYRTDDRFARRGLEQMLYDQYPRAQHNHVRAISSTNTNRDKYMEAAYGFIFSRE